MTPDKKLCPLLVAARMPSAPRSMKECVQDECAWWDEDTAMCSINLLAIATNAPHG